MKARGGFLLAACVTLAALAAGCTGGGTEVNPNLLAPKLIVDASVNGTPLVYVHSAFGERAYDVIEVRVDNESRRVTEYAYSLEEKLNASDFFLEVDVRAGESRFDYTARFRLDADEERVRVTVLDPDGEWHDSRENLPYSTILNRRGPMDP